MLEKKVDKIAGVINRFAAIISITAMVVATLLVGIETITRYTMGISHQWAEELCRYLLIGSAFIYCGPLLYKDGHVILDIIVKSVKNKTFLKLYNLFVCVLALVVGTLLTLWGMELVTRFGTLRSASLIYPMWLPYSLVPIGMSIMVVLCVLKIIKLLVRREENV